MGTGDGVVEAIRRAGGIGRLPEVRGQWVAAFDVVAVAEALEREVVRAREVGFPKVSVHLDLDDAVQLAAALRRVR